MSMDEGEKPKAPNQSLFNEQRMVSRKNERKTFVWTLVVVAFAFYISVQAISSAFKNTIEPPASSYNVFEDIFTDINGLRDEIHAVRTLAESGASITEAVLLNQMSQLEQRYNNISDTLMESPDEAITAKVLKLEQKATEAKLSFLQEEVTGLRNRIDDFMFGVVTTALLGVVFALAVSLIGAAVKYFLSASEKKKKENKE